VEFELAHLMADYAQQPRRRRGSAVDWGRAPGWHAGVVVARRQLASAAASSADIAKAGN